MVKHKLRARHAQHTYFTSAFVTILKPRHNQKQPKITNGQNDLSFTPRSLRGLKMTRVLMRIAGRVHLNTHAEYKISCSSFLCSCHHSSFLLQQKWNELLTPINMKWFSRCASLCVSAASVCVSSTITFWEVTKQTYRCVSPARLRSAVALKTHSADMSFIKIMIG